MRLLLVPFLWLACAVQAGTVSVTVIDKEGKPVADAVVVVTPSAGGQPRHPLPVQATIAQEKMQFVPTVTLVPPGATLTFVTQDSWDHHVRAAPAGAAQFTAAATDGFELRLDGKAAGKAPKSLEVTVDKPGAMLLGCHIHGSMRGYVYVTDSAWAMKTSAEGQAVFDDVPDGAAQVRVWQPEQLFDLPQRPVTVGSVPARASFQLQVVPRRRRI
ncbi:MAG: methylamine utilization protein [Ramlibacter sp.]